MRFERSTTQSFIVPARPTLTPSNWLLYFVKKDDPTQIQACIASAYAVTGQPVRVEFEEVSSGAVNTGGEITLELGQWNLSVHEQTSTTNLNEANANRRNVFTALVEVVGAAIDPVPPLDPCDSCPGGGGDVDVTVNSEAYDTVTSPDSLDIPIVNTADTAVGTVDPGVEVEVGDSTVTLNGTIISTPPAETTDAVECSDLVNAVVVSGAGISEADGVYVLNAARIVNGHPVYEHQDDAGAGDDRRFAVSSGDWWLLLSDNVTPEASFNYSSPSASPAPDQPYLVDQGDWVEDTAPMLPIPTIAQATVGDLCPCDPCEDATYQLKDTAGTNIGAAGSIPSGDSANITAPDATLTLNSAAFGTVVSNGTEDIQVLNEDFVTPVGSDFGFPLIIVGSSLVYTTDGLTLVDQILAEQTYNLRQSVIQYVNAAGSNTATSAYNTRYDGATNLFPDLTVSRRELYDDTPAPLGLYVTLDDLINDTVPQVPAAATPSGIVYQFGYGLASGQTVTYRTGDEGSYRAAGFFEYTRPSYPSSFASLASGDWYTLAANNIHGNTTRFTNTAGGAAATSGDRIIQDHLTGLEWWIPGSLPSATTWNNAIDACEAATSGSLTDWLMPNDRMLDSITQDNQAQPLNYSPFSISSNLWTSTTDPNTTTSARRVLTATNGNIASDPKGSNNTYIYCRKFL